MKGDIMLSRAREPLVEMFVFEVSQLLEQLECNISRVAKVKKFDLELIDDICGIMHTIQGTSSMLLYNTIFLAANSIEKLFQCLRVQEENINNPKIITLLLDASNFIRRELIKIEEELEPTGNANVYVDRVSQILYELTSEYDKDNKTLYQATIHFEDDCGMEGLRAFSIMYMLGEVAQHIITTNINEDYEEKNDIIKKEGIVLQFFSEASHDKILDLIVTTPYIKKVKLNKLYKKTNTYCMTV